MDSALMTLKIVLPSRVFTEIDAVTTIVAETRTGSFGLLPHRLDCAATLVPGILIYTTAGKEVCLAIDHGVLVKTGADVLVAVRGALSGTDINMLREEVAQHFLSLDEQERSARNAMLRLETGFLQRASGLQHA